VAAERRKLSAEEQKASRQQTLRRIRGESVPEDDPQVHLKRVNNEWVLDVQSRYQDRLIRRDLRSIRWDGATINQALPPKEIIAATCRLNEMEMEVLDCEIDDLSNRSDLIF
jgi:hypothetical protein